MICQVVNINSVDFVGFWLSVIFRWHFEKINWVKTRRGANVIYAVGTDGIETWAKIVLVYS